MQVTSNANLPYLFFDLMPGEITKLIFSYMKGEKNSIPSLEEDKTIIATARVCKSWQNNPALQEIRQEAKARLYKRITHDEMRLNQHYSPDIVRIFKIHYSSIAKLPVLQTDYIDFLELEDMNESVMRFHDVSGRRGIVLKIHANKSLVLRTELQDLSKIILEIKKELQNKNFILSLLYVRVLYQTTKKLLRERGEHTSVLALFKNNPTNNTWTYTWGNNNPTIENLYRIRHETDHVADNCPTCLFSNNRINEIPLLRILKGQDPDFSLFEKDADIKIYTRTILITALTIVTLTYLASYYFMVEKAS